MSADLVVESTGATLVGQDTTGHVGKPVVEVSFATSRPQNGGPMGGEEGLDTRETRIATGIAALQKARASHGKVPTPAPTPEPAKAPEPPPPEPDEPAVDPLEVTPAGDEAETLEPEKAAEKPADEKPAPEPEKKPEPATSAIELEQLRSELALERAKSERFALARVTDEQREEWLASPTKAVRALIAERLGVAPDSPEMKAELAHIQRELTLDSLGDSGLNEQQRQQRSIDHLARRERLAPTVRAASETASKSTELRKQTVALVGRAYETVKTDFPFADLATDIDGISPAEAALDLWLAEVKAGRITPDKDDAVNVREAFKLADTRYRTKLATITKRQSTAPNPPSSSTDAAPKGAAPGAPAAKTTAPPKGRETPTTLSATKAAAAPPAKTSTPPPTADVEADPRDPDATRKARIAIWKKRGLLK